MLAPFKQLINADIICEEYCDDQKQIIKDFYNRNPLFTNIPIYYYFIPCSISFDINNEDIIFIDTCIALDNLNEAIQRALRYPHHCILFAKGKGYEIVKYTKFRTNVQSKNNLTKTRESSGIKSYIIPPSHYKILRSYTCKNIDYINTTSNDKKLLDEIQKSMDKYKDKCDIQIIEVDTSSIPESPINNRPDQELEIIDSM